MKLDFTGVSAGGFTVLPSGRYRVKVDYVNYYIKEETGNPVFFFNLEVTEGEYKGSTVGMFKAYTEKVGSRGALLSILATLGIITEDDRDDKGVLEVGVKFGGTDDRGYTEVKAFVTANGEERSPEGATAVAVVSKRKEGERESNTVDRLEADSSAPDALAGGEKADQGQSSIEDIW